MIWGPIGAAIGGLLGGIIDNKFGGGKNDGNMTIKANAASINADFATANFKQVTLPASYIGRGVPSNNATAGVTNITVNNNIRGSVIAERDLKNTMRETANDAITASKAADSRWQPVTVQGV
jgi:hypothetical protein